MIARGTAGGREPVGLFFALVVHLLLNGTSLVTRDGAEDAHVRVPYPRALCKLYKPNVFLQPSLHHRRDSKVAYPVETYGLYHEVHKSLGPTETDESKPRTGLLGPQVRRVRPRAEHDVRTYRFLPADTRYIRIWNITTYHTYIRIWYTRPRVKKSRRRYISSNGKSKRKCWYIYQVREQTIFCPNNL